MVNQLELEAAFGAWEAVGVFDSVSALGRCDMMAVRGMASPVSSPHRYASSNSEFALMNRPGHKLRKELRGQIFRRRTRRLYHRMLHRPYLFFLQRAEIQIHK
jgi:hypothetical protein